LRSAEQALRAAVEYRPGPRRAGAAHPAPAGAAAPGPPDLDRVDEETHRRLYDHVVQQEFTRQELQPPGDDWVPGYTPEQAGLKIFFLWGRWFATWRKLEVPRDRPEGERREVVRFVLDPGAAGGLRLDGV